MKVNGPGMPVFKLRFIKFRLISRIYRSKMGPRENHCHGPSLSSITSATPLGGLWVRPYAVLQDAFNSASQAEPLAKPLHMYMCDSGYQLLKDSPLPQRLRDIVKRCMLQANDAPTQPATPRAAKVTKINFDRPF
jgi:hypothetical protein